MPFKRVVEIENPDPSGPRETQAELAKKLLEAPLAKLDLVSVRRYPKSGKAKPVGLPIQVRYDPATEDAEVFANELAGDALKIAIEDAGEKRVKFQIVGLAEALPKQAAGVLFDYDTWVNADEEDRPATKDSEAVGMLRTAREHMSGVSTEHLKLLKETNSLVGMVTSVLGKMVEGDSSRWAAEVELAKIKREADVAGATLIANMENTRSRHGMWTGMINRAAPIAETLLDVVAGRNSKNASGPTPEELDKCFTAHAPDLRDAALQVIRTEDEAKRRPLVLDFVKRWHALDTKVQAEIMKSAFEALGEGRAKELASWLAALVKSAEGAA